MKRWVWLFPVALATMTVPMLTTTAHADEKGEHEKVVRLEDIPAPARETILREAAGSPILNVEQETEKSKTFYEANVKRGDDVVGIQVDAQGKLIGKHSEKAEKKRQREQK